MKIQLKLIVILLVFALIVYYSIEYFFTCFVLIKNFNQIIFIFLCIILQDRIINFIMKKILKSNSQLFDIKKQVYFIFKNKQENFNEYYDKVRILKKIELALFIQRELCYTKLKNISEAELHLKIDKKGLKDVYESIPFKSKNLIKREMEKYYLFLSNTEDIYLECETKDIIKRDDGLSILEYSLVWLSYIVLIWQLLGLNGLGTETVTFIKTFIFLSIVDISKHIMVYKISLKFEIEKYKKFNESIIKMEKMILDPDNTRYKLYDGKLVPHFNIKDSI